MTLSLAPGLHENVPFDDYLADPCATPSLSASIALTIITRSPLHAYHRHPRLGNGARDESDTADLGTIAHDLLLHGENKIDVLDFPDYRTKAAQEAKAAARAAGRAPILRHKYAEVEAMVEAAREFIATSEIRDEWRPGISEATIVTEEDGVLCRIRPDRYRESSSAVMHYKTTDGTARPDEFIRGVFRRMEYGFTAAFYAGRLARSWGGAAPPQFILVQEQSAPYACSLIGLTPAKLAIESARVERAVNLWRECTRTGKWPGYGGRVHYAEPAPWELAAAEQAKLEEAA